MRLCECESELRVRLCERGEIERGEMESRGQRAVAWSTKTRELKIRIEIEKIAD